MNVKSAAEKSAELIPTSGYARDPRGTSLHHAHWLLIQIIRGIYVGESAYMRLGWAQAIMCFNGCTTLAKITKINHTS